MRLLHEDVLAGADAGLGVHRVELRRAGDQHHVDALDHLLVAVEAGEEMVLVGDDLAGPILLEPVILGLQAIGENVAHGGQFHVGAGLQRLFRRAAAAPAAANHADLDLLLAGGMRTAGDAQPAQGRRRRPAEALRNARRVGRVEFAMVRSPGG